MFVSKEHAICEDLVWNVPTFIRGKFPSNHALLKSIQTKHFYGSRNYNMNVVTCF